MLVDVNILIYASLPTVPEYERARAWLDAQFNGTIRVGLPWISLMGFLRIVTNPRATHRAPSMQDAWGQVKSWLACPMVWIPQPTDQHVRIFESLLPYAGSGGNLIQDV